MNPASTVQAASLPSAAGGHGFGTAPVFLASISTILGAVMFLRFGYAVGNLGLAGAILLILIGHLVTIPTAMAIAEIATNRGVEGGGEYYIISRSFGTTIGGAIGISLYLSQAVSRGGEEGVRGRQTLKKALVAIAAEEDGAGRGRIRMKRIRRASKQQLHGFIQEAVEPDSTIHTDGWEGYVGLEALGYRHEYDFVATSSQSASELLPRVHRVAALLKRWLMGTHQGAVSREHLDYYLDEYTFRFNRRRSRHRGKLFYRLEQQAAAVGPTTYSEMVQHVRGRRISQPQDMG